MEQKLKKVKKCCSDLLPLSPFKLRWILHIIQYIDLNHEVKWVWQMHAAKSRRKIFPISPTISVSPFPGFITTEATYLFVCVCCLISITIDWFAFPWALSKWNHDSVTFSLCSFCENHNHICDMIWLSFLLLMNMQVVSSL